MRLDRIPKSHFLTALFFSIFRSNLLHFFLVFCYLTCPFIKEKAGLYFFFPPFVWCHNWVLPGEGPRLTVIGKQPVQCRYAVPALILFNGWIDEVYNYILYTTARVVCDVSSTQCSFHGSSRWSYAVVALDNYFGINCTQIQGQIWSTFHHW